MDSLSYSSSSTSASLIKRVQSQDHDAWDRFVGIYAPLIYDWARRGGLQQIDAEDVVQDVFRTVLAKIGGLQWAGNAGNLRGWLWVVTRNRVRQFFRGRSVREHAAGGSTAAVLMSQVPELWQRDVEPSTPSDQAALLHRALGQIRGDFAEDTWQAFWRLAIEQQSAAEIAAHLGVTEGAVRQAKYRVLSRLRDELA